MRKMKKKEMEDFIREHTWTTLCTVDTKGNPYAVEFTYFLLDGDIYGLLKPMGRTAANLAFNERVCLKMCRTDERCRSYIAVSCFGRGGFVQEPENVLRGWDLLEERLGLPPGTYDPFKERFRRKRKKYPLFRARVESMTGIASAGAPEGTVPTDPPRKKKTRRKT